MSERFVSAKFKERAESFSINPLDNPSNEQLLLGDGKAHIKSLKLSPKIRKLEKKVQNYQLEQERIDKSLTSTKGMTFDELVTFATNNMYTFLPSEDNKNEPTALAKDEINRFCEENNIATSIDSVRRCFFVMRPLIGKSSDHILIYKNSDHNGDFFEYVTSWDYEKTGLARHIAQPIKTPLRVGILAAAGNLGIIKAATIVTGGLGTFMFGFSIFSIIISFLGVIGSFGGKDPTDNLSFSLKALNKSRLWKISEESR